MSFTFKLAFLFTIFFRFICMLILEKKSLLDTRWNLVNILIEIIPNYLKSDTLQEYFVNNGGAFCLCLSWASWYVRQREKWWSLEALSKQEHSYQKLPRDGVGVRLCCLMSLVIFCRMEPCGLLLLYSLSKEDSGW